MKKAALLSLLLTLPLPAATPLDEGVRSIIPALLETYRTLHANPEVSLQESQTSKFLAERLRALGYEVHERVGQYTDTDATAWGIVAVLRNGSGRTVLLRSDMDALPVNEETGVPWASRNQGVMHACGHDVHMTTLLGVAEMLVKTKSQWKGTVMLVGQPAEEVVKGAQGMLRAGIYEKIARPDYAIALHDWAVLASGRIGYRAGYFLSAADSINLKIRGVGGHGAAPHTTKDPVVLAAETILALQTITSREKPPLAPAVITVGKIDGGTKRNIIPNEVNLFLTVRTFAPEVREQVLAAIQRIPRGLAIAAGVPEDRAPLYEHLAGESVAATHNDPALTARVAAAAARELGEEAVVEIEPAMVSEDFGLFGLDGKIPTTLLALGAGDPAAIAAGTQPGLHSSRFVPHDPGLVLSTGVRGATAVILDLLRN